MRALLQHIIQKALRLWPLLLPLVILLPVLNGYPYPSPTSEYSDLTLAHYSYVAYQRMALWEQGRFPLWSSIILSGHPLAANPLSGMWYPPGWLALVAPLPFAFNLGIIAHLLWGGIGLYILLRQEGRSRLAALLACMAFTALPKLYAHYGAGHLTLLYAVPWTPWLLYFSRRKSAQGLWSWMSSIALALIFLADPRWAPFAGLLWWAYALLQRNPGNKPISFKLIVGQLIRLFGQTLLAVALAAPLALPLIEFTQRSSRAHMAAEDVFSFSLPIARLLGLFFPDFGGFHEWILYSGATILLFSLLAIVRRKSLPGSAFWIWSAFLSLLFALGSSLPVLPNLARLPVIGLLRVPSRSLFITGLSMAALASYALDQLLGSEMRLHLRSARLVILLVTALTLSLTGMLWMVSGEVSLNFLWGAGAMFFSAIWISLRLSGRISARPWFFLLLLICLFDWGMVNRSLFSSRSAEDVFTEAGELASYLARQSGNFRVYSPSYSIPQHIAAKYHLQLADGVDPLQLQSYVDFMKAATQVPWTGYSVTTPPFAGGNPHTDNASYQPDSRLLGWLNVRFVAAEFDLRQDGLNLVDQFGTTRLYENRHYLPRAWVQPVGAPVGMDNVPAEPVSWTPERIEILADGPGMLVLSELSYPGWSVWVDDQPAELIVVQDLLRGVELDSGSHQVVFAYRPMSIVLGLGIFLVAVSYILASYFWHRQFHVSEERGSEY